jgi:aryl-alcohol dehydrogenase-like predicted oxidoreductase
MAYAPLATGLLSGVYTPGSPPPPGTLWGERRRDQFGQTLAGRAAEALELVSAIASRLGVSVPQVALAWVLAHPEITVAISGADTPAQFDENLGALDVALSPDDLRALDEASGGLSMVLDGAPYGPPVPQRVTA